MVTLTHRSNWPQLCHPDGCPTDARARQLIVSQETVALPGPFPLHQVEARPYFCKRIACARLPEQRQRRGLHAAMSALDSATATTEDPFPALAVRARRFNRRRALDQIESELRCATGAPEDPFARAVRRRRSKREDTRNQIESELRCGLRDALLRQPGGLPEALDGFPSLLTEFRAHELREREQTLARARTVARLLPTATFPAIEGPPRPACEVRAPGWRALLEKPTGNGLLLVLLRADERPEGNGLVFTVQPDDVPQVAWLWARRVRGVDCEFSLDDEAAAWAREQFPDPDFNDLFDLTPTCLARAWWAGTFGEDPEFPLPDMDPDCTCGDGRRHPPVGDVLPDGTVAVGLWVATWRTAEHVPDGHLEAVGTETSPKTGTPPVQITSNTATLLRLCCGTAETMPMDAAAGAVRQVAQTFQPEAVHVTVADLIDEGRKVRRDLVPYREGGTVRLRRAAPRPAPQPTAPAEPGLLPPGFDRLVIPGEPVTADMMVQAWRQDAPWGIHEGSRDLTPAESLAPQVWTPAVDATLTRLVGQYAGFAPSVFASAYADQFPAVVAAAASNPVVARSSSIRFEAAHGFGPVAALVFSRLLAIASWSMPSSMRCPLCRTDFDPQLLDVRHVVQYGPARWCNTCAWLGWGSYVETRDEALRLVAHLAGVLGTAPSREWPRHPVPHDVPPAERDRLMAARMAMPGEASLLRLGLTNWGAMLAAAGVLVDGLQTPRGLASRAVDGHWCKSMLELAVDDFFSSSRIGHECEPGWPQHPTLNPYGARRADWRLPDGTYVEAAGLMDDPAYAEKMSQKRVLAEQVGVRLVVVMPSDLNRLGALFAEWMPLDPLGQPAARGWLPARRDQAPVRS